MRLAAIAGLTSERAIRYYAEVMLMLGSGFATDPMLTFVPGHLGDPPKDELARERAQNARIDRLYVRAWEHVDVVLPDLLAGETDGGARFVRALEEVDAAKDAPWTANTPPFVRRRVLETVAPLFPRTLGEVGEATFIAGIDAALEAAWRVGLATERGALVAAWLRLMTNARVDGDPAHPWIAEALAAAPAAPSHRASVLVARAIDHLRTFWS
jgi:hypothetical protein